MGIETLKNYIIKTIFYIKLVGTKSVQRMNSVLDFQGKKISLTKFRTNFMSLFI